MLTSLQKRQLPPSARFAAACSVLIVCLILGKLFFPVSDPIFLFGTSVYTVGSRSMEPNLPIHSVVVIHKTPFEQLDEGDVIAFRSDALGGKTALHRIVRIEDNAVVTKGDANRHEDNQLVTSETYEGKCVVSFRLHARYLALIKTPLGFFVFLVLPIVVTVISIRILKQATQPVITSKK